MGYAKGNGLVEEVKMWNPRSHCIYSKASGVFAKRPARSGQWVSQVEEREVCPMVPFCIVSRDRSITPNKRSASTRHGQHPLPVLIMVSQYIASL